MIVFLYKESEQDFYDKYGPSSKQTQPKSYHNIDIKRVKDIREKVWYDEYGNKIDIEDVSIVVQEAIEKVLSIFPTSIGKILNKKPILITDNPSVRTFATDGINLFISPFYVYGLANHPKTEDCLVDAIAYILIHEALHVVFRHVYEERTDPDFTNHDKCNITQDCQINLYIEKVLSKAYPEIEGMTDILGGIIDNGYIDMHWRDIYNELPNDHYWLKKTPKATTPSFKKGFTDGYNYVMGALRKNKLIESYGI